MDFATNFMEYLAGIWRKQVMAGGTSEGVSSGSHCYALWMADM